MGSSPGSILNQMNCLVSMETSPRAATWTVEDIGTQLHHKNDEKKSGVVCCKKHHFWARVREWWGGGFYSCLSHAWKHIWHHSCRQLIMWPSTGVLMPLLTHHFQEPCTCGRFQMKRDMVKHGRVHTDYSEGKWLSGWSVWAAAAASS